MPMIRVATNIANEKIPAGFELLLTDVLAESMGKPRGRINIEIAPGLRMIHGGSDAPVTVISIRSIGALSEVDNIRHTQRVTELCEKELGLHPEKVIIEFFNLAPHEVGFGGTTVAEALKPKQ